jgi:predicted cobalt transporter CbtA
MKKQHSITELPPSPDEERRARQVRYSIAMAIRLVCLICIFFVHEWWLIVIIAAGAIILPYVAVVLANVHIRPTTADVVRPGAVVRIEPRESDKL